MSPDEFAAHGFTREQELAIRGIRVRFTVRSKDDQRSDDTVADLVPVPVALPSLCRCLVCACRNKRTIDYPTVCRECAHGSHVADPHGGVL